VFSSARRRPGIYPDCPGPFSESFGQGAEEGILQVPAVFEDLWRFLVDALIRDPLTKSSLLNRLILGTLCNSWNIKI